MGKSKIILKLNTDNNVVLTYKSTVECCKKEKIERGKLRRLIKTSKPHNGFIFKFSGEFSDEKQNIETNEKKFKCPYCKQSFKTYNGLCKHVFSHNGHPEITKEELLTQVFYNGVRPKCKCGCGEYTDISYSGGIHFNEYVNGHNSRIINNWGHNPIAIKNSAQTRREQYASGERKTWIDGKKWEDVFTQEEIKILKEKIYTSERNNKIREYQTGRPKSPEHAEKCRENGRKEENKEKIRQSIYKRINEGKFNLSSNLEKEFIETYIEPLNLEFKTQYYIKDIKQYCDIYIPSKNLIIECDGSFWHSDPRLFPEGPRYDYQIKKVEKDKIKNVYLLNNGYNLLRIWEYDIIHNPKYVKNLLTEHI